MVGAATRYAGMLIGAYGFMLAFGGNLSGSFLALGGVSLIVAGVFYTQDSARPTNA